MNTTQERPTTAVRKRVRFSGRVQGVGFRVTTRDIARGFDVSGWVRNEPCGTVLLEAQGDEHQVRAFIDELASRMDHFITSTAQVCAPIMEGERGFAIQSDAFSL